MNSLQPFPGKQSEWDGFDRDDKSEATAYRTNPVDSLEPLAKVT